MFKKILYTIALTAVAVSTAQGQRGIGYRGGVRVIAPQPRIGVRIIPQFVLQAPMWSYDYCWYYYGYYPCDPYVYVVPPVHRTVVVIIGNNNPVPVQKEVVDTVYVKDSTMKDTIKVIKHN